MDGWWFDGWIDKVGDEFMAFFRSIVNNTQRQN